LGTLKRTEEGGEEAGPRRGVVARPRFCVLSRRLKLDPGEMKKPSEKMGGEKHVVTAGTAGGHVLLVSGEREKAASGIDEKKNRITRLRPGTSTPQHGGRMPLNGETANGVGSWRRHSNRLILQKARRARFRGWWGKKTGAPRGTWEEGPRGGGKERERGFSQKNNKQGKI